jgi:hypothetical protein
LELWLTPQLPPSQLPPLHVEQPTPQHEEHVEQHAVGP